MRYFDDDGNMIYQDNVPETPPTEETDSERSPWIEICVMIVCVLVVMGALSGFFWCD